MTNEILSEWPVAQNVLFILFAFCFFIGILFIGPYRRLLMAMLYHLFRRQKQQTVSSQTVNNEFFIKLILCLQTILLFSILIYCIFSRIWNLPFESTIQFVRILGGTALIFLIFILYKFFTHLGVWLVFFQRESVQSWNTLFFSMLSLSGIVLFIPALLIFYFPNLYYFGVYSSLIYFLFVEILMFYKIFKIFFQQKISLLYFILYLCTQELLPVFFVYKALVYFYRM